MPFEYVWKLGYSSNTILPPSLSNNYTKPGMKRGDNSYFRCFVTDKNGCSRESSPRTKVDIQYPPYYASLTAIKPAVCLNNMASLRCYASGNPRTVTLVLYSGGQVLASSTNDYTATLQFNSTTAGTHTYVCKTNNSAGIGVNASRTMITQAPPQITGITVNQTIAEGSRLVLECNTSGSDPMTITWKKVGGSAFPSGKNVTFESLTTADQGAYECTASNGNECPVSKLQTYVHVLYKPRRTSITVSNSTVCLNDLVQLECTTEADPPATHYHFYVNDQLIQSSSSSRIQMNSTIEGNNTYRCQPGNTVGLGENATVFMNTKAPPNITWLPPNQSIAEGSTVLFPCNVTGSDPMKIVWKNVRVNSSYPIGHHLKFQSLMRSHDGVYECSASNGNECPLVSSSTYINVLYQPEITKSPKSTLTLFENGTINLNCKAHGNPAPNITWTRGSDVVGRGEILVLEKEQSAQGVYVCIASNGVGVNARANSNVVVKICENFCQQNNTCIRQGSTQSCDCRKGLTGRYCEKDDPMGKKFSIKVVLVSPAWKDQ
ncbi:roundabout homolog 1-like [Actinia tenebrosa]|uniref:Roundabout homolog 1-like n=1 Tax=Actinia tenebrosa TaxID=6105 RepID=A0A6P8J233_ACTTE|nr:roundabout homolog 1-like [Actinia tenebrosa]